MLKKLKKKTQKLESKKKKKKTLELDLNGQLGTSFAVAATGSVSDHSGFNVWSGLYPSPRCQKPSFLVLDSAFSLITNIFLYFSV
jgi:hypothetical protein